MSGAVVSCTLNRMAVTILIVDDHDGFRAWARELLEREGLVVVGEAASGASAVRAVAALAPDVVLLDVRLPDSNGFQVAAEIAGRTPAPDIVMTSSHELGDVRHLLAHSPARGFVPKSDLSRSRLEEVLGSPRP